MNKTLIIAEAGVNHNGCLKTAKQLIDVASDAGADFIKFQTFKAKDLVSIEAKKAEYQSTNLSDASLTQYEMLQSLELSDSDHSELIKYCRSRNIKFFSTAFDNESLKYLNTIGLEMFKIPSGEITNYPYLKLLADIGKPIILSTGMSNLKEIEAALNVLEMGIAKSDITILHCNSQYPTPMEDVNLKAMLTIKDAFKVKVGYSDHTLGIEVPIAAVALGACVIEKHITLDRNMVGPDHKASIEPNELKTMIQSIRNIENALSGDGKKDISPSEEDNREIVRKSIFVRKKLPKGAIIEESDLIALRPGDGISSMEWNNVIGKKTKRKIQSYSKLNFNDLE